MKLEIFRVGKHISNNGTPIEFTEDDLRQAVKSYDPSLHEAPLVIGHPKDGAPAYGWIKSMEYNEKEQKVYAELDQVDAGVQELVNAGRYKKRSASWYSPTNPNNPKPGSLYIRHLGLLGAQAPALKGMPNISFSDTEEESTFEFGEKTMLESLKSWITAKFGAQEAALAFGEELDEATKAAIQAEADKKAKDEADALAFAEQQKQEADEAATKTALEAQAAELAQKALQLQEQEIASFCEGLITAGKMLPAEKQKVKAVFSLLYKQSEQFDFSEDGAGDKVSAADALKEIFSSRPKIVDFSEIGAEQGTIEEPKADFIIPAGCVVDPQQLAELAKAQAYMKTANVDLQTALKQTAK